MPTENTQPPKRILVIDDNDAIHNDFRKTLNGPAETSSKLASAKAALFGDANPAVSLLPRLPKFELVSAMQGEEGLAKLLTALREKRPFTVAFVDMRMPPGWDGVQTIQKLWEADPDIQVVICTAYSDYSWDEISQQLGMSDRLLILKKPFDPIEVAQLAVSLSEKWTLKQRAELKLEQMERLVNDRTAELLQAATHDKLTGLPNRALLRDRLNQSILRHQRDPNFHFALLFLDFDRFKVVNDSLGHEVGDQLLVAISQRLAETLRTTDSVSGPPASGDGSDSGSTGGSGSTAARMGGDEFVILADGMKSVRDEVVVAERMLAALGAPYQLGGHTIVSTVSIGITSSAVGYERADDMIRDADTAMYRAKAAGKGRFVVFDQTMHENALAWMELETSLRQAVERNQFVLHYQPIVSLATGALEGFEALVRWNHPTRGLVAPADFIPCCEETGMIIPLGAWVLTEACSQLKRWQQQFSGLAGVSMSVNISPRQLSDPGFADAVTAIFNRTGVSPTSVIFEITEALMIRDPDSVIPLLGRIRQMGVRLHMDDFGTGYSSLSCLHRFPLTGIKIDKSFIDAIKTGKDSPAVIKGVISISQGLGLAVTAEGIETAEQAQMLRSADCLSAQGFHFSQPLTEAGSNAYLSKRTASASDQGSSIRKSDPATRKDAA